MDVQIVKNAAFQFFGAGGDITVEPLGNGLIHQTYRATHNGSGKSIVLQAINTAIFKRPVDLVDNYLEVYEYLEEHKNEVVIPAPIPAADGRFLWIDDGDNYWRAAAFIDNSYSPATATNEKEAQVVAKNFAAFTNSLTALDASRLHIIIPGFHDLLLRYQQFEEVILQAPVRLLLKATHVIAELRDRASLLEFYESIQNSADYPVRVMHHDCKISNILFDKNTDQPIGPVDLDTIMPGSFFSDIGDMIRTMACSVDENSTRWEDIAILPSYYASVLQGYLGGMSTAFTGKEKKNIHYAGLLLTFMQTLRFVTDFLQGDIYYKTTYPEQNLNRALNQLILLERLEEFLEKEYSFKP